MLTSIVFMFLYIYFRMVIIIIQVAQQGRWHGDWQEEN